ncbi:DUF7283 family protein [Salarchaeum japonicum]|uniref:DUF7283 family protein n=1 Tax=Salarchaeum japonicum TaxID=555573 RepID=UPI001D0A2B63|nr:hypothetical protein [Salarchaeum japonicum]
MFDAADALATWVGLTLAGAALVAAALAIPAAPPPDATAVAATIDRVAASDYDADEAVHLDADSVRVTPRSIGLRGSGGRASAALVARVVPVPPDGPLAAVLAGRDPALVFDTSVAFVRAAAAARAQPPVWRAAETLRVRHLAWRGTDVVLVG